MAAMAANARYGFISTIFPGGRGSDCGLRVRNWSRVNNFVNNLVEAGPKSYSYSYSHSYSYIYTRL